MSFQAQGHHGLVPAPDPRSHQDGFVPGNSAMRILLIFLARALEEIIWFSMCTALHDIPPTHMNKYIL